MRAVLSSSLVLASSLLSASTPAWAAGPAAIVAAAQPAATAQQAGLVDVASLAPAIVIEMRYLGSNNFTGAPVPGYHANICYLRAPAAQALARVQQRVQAQGYWLQVFDCYRPVQAVRSFVAWAHAPADPAAKVAYFPNIAKPDLLDGYISATSGHSRGHTVDLGLLDCRHGPCHPLDMGTAFDFFDPAANVGHRSISTLQQANRDRLQQAMLAEGFEPYAMEWWHFSHPEQREQALALDVPVR